MEATATQPIYEQELPTAGLPPETMLGLLHQAVGTLGWTVVHLSPNLLVAHTTYRTLEYEEVVCELLYDVIRISSRSMELPEGNVPINQANVVALTGQLDALKRAYGIVAPGDIVATPAQPVADILDVAEDGEPQKAWGVLGLFVPRKGYMATPLLVWLNILVFALMVWSGADFIDPDARTLFAWGGNLGYRTAQGDWWRLLTAMFLHGGVMHLLMNMYALVFVGVILERTLGTLRFTTAYMVTGVLASLASVYMHPGTVSVGASGAIFGMYGVYIGLMSTSTLGRKDRKAALWSMVLYVAYSMGSGIKEAGIDNAAHIGGLVAGLLAGYALYYSLRQRKSKATMYIVLKAMVIVTLLLSIYVLGLVGG